MLVIIYLFPIHHELNAQGISGFDHFSDGDFHWPSIAFIVAPLTAEIILIVKSAIARLECLSLPPVYEDSKQNTAIIGVSSLATGLQAN